MANKQIAVSVLSAVSEVTLNKIIAAAKVPKKAATVVRDSNGKVIQVIIKLPPTAAAAAIIAIKATAGVADVVTTDIQPGQEGYDGSEAGWDELIANGYTTQSYNDGVFTDNLDGTRTYASASQTVAADSLTGIAKAPIFPIPVTLEVRESVDGTYTNGRSPFSLSVADDIHSYNLNHFIDSGIHYIGIQDDTIGNTTAVITPGTTMHNYKLVVDETGLAKAYYDGVEKISLQLGVVPSGNYIVFNNAAFNTGTITVDFARWTAA